jgi:thiol-disulfide isomerase/thioredoxin
MFHRRAVLVAAAVVAVAAVAPVLAASPVIPFSQEAFEAAQKAGKPILVEIHADWCPTCKVQAPIVSELRDDPKFKDMVVFRVDYDGQRDIVKRFGARTQSTLIAFKGTSETGRSVGDTNKASIQSLLAKTI